MTYQKRRKLRMTARFALMLSLSVWIGMESGCGKPVPTAPPESVQIQETVTEPGHSESLYQLSADVDAAYSEPGGQGLKLVMSNLQQGAYVRVIDGPVVVDDQEWVMIRDESDCTGWIEMKFLTPAG